MANKSRTVDIVFNGVDDFTKPLGNMNKALDQFDAKIKAVTGPITETAEALLKFEGAAALVAATIGGIALKNFSDYQYALIDLNKVLSDTEKNALPKAEKEIKSLATTYGQSTVDLIQRTTEFRKASFTLNESLMLVREGLNLTSAANTEMGASTKNLITILKGFGKEASEAAHIVDVINIVSDKYATNAEQLGTALSKVAPLADLAGLSIEELTGFMVPTIEVFQDSGEAATAWRRALAKLFDDTGPVKEAFEDILHIQTSNNGVMKTGKQLLFEVADAFQRMSKEQQIQTSTMLFGNRQVAKLLTSLRDLDYVMEVESVAAGVKHSYTLEQVAKRWASIQNVFANAKESLTQASIALGSSLEPAAVKVLKSLDNLFDVLETQVATGAFKSLFAVFDEFGDSLSTYITNLGKTLPDIFSNLDYSKLNEAFRGIFTEISRIFEALDLKTPEGVADFLQTAIDLMGGLINTSRGALSALGDFIPLVRNIVNQFIGLDTQQQAAFGKVSAQSAIFEKLGSKGVIFLQTLTDNLTKTADSFVRGMGAVKSITSYVVFAASYVARVWGSLDYIGNAIIGALKGDLANTLDKLDAKYLALEKSEYAAYSGVAEGVNEVVFGLNDLSKKGDDATGSVKKAFDDLLSSIKDVGSGLGDALDSGLKTTKDKAKNVTSDIEEYYKSAVEAIKKANDIEAEQKPQVAQGKWKSLKEGSVSIVEETTDRVKKFGDFMDTWGEGIGETTAAALDKGLAEGSKKALSKSLGYFGDSELELFNATDRVGKQLDDRISSSYKPPAKEVEPPADEKFKAAQKLLLEEIKTNADIVQEQYKTLAVGIESDSKTITTALEAVNSTFEASTTSIASMYSTLASSDLDLGTKTQLQGQIRAEQDRQEEAFELQKALTEAQIDLIQKRAAALESGEAIITVNGEGLQPHLEAFMFEILSAIKTKVSESYNSFLLGLA